MTREDLDDDDIEDWIMNDEGLYDWYISEGGDEENTGLAEFIQRHRTNLVECIGNVLEGIRPAHYLKYGG